MHAAEYKDWRMTGIAFETRLTTNDTPNRTMSSSIPGKKVLAIIIKLNLF
jgi:dynein assembly factor 3